MQAKPKILLGYIQNISQADECYSDEIHRICCQFAYQKGWIRGNDIIPTVEIDRLSNTLPTLQQIITDAENGQLDVLVLHSFAQLQISAPEAFSFIENLTKHNVLICSASEGVTSETPIGKLQLYLLATINEVRRKTLTKSSHELRYEADHVEKLEKVLTEKVGLVLSLSELAEHERHR